MNIVTNFSYHLPAYRVNTQISHYTFFAFTLFLIEFFEISDKSSLHIKNESSCMYEERQLICIRYALNIYFTLIQHQIH